MQKNRECNNEGIILRSLVERGCTVQELAELLKPLVLKFIQQAERERNQLELRVDEMLERLGFPRDMEELKYLKEAIMVCSDTSRAEVDVVGEVYSYIAKRYGFNKKTIQGKIGESISYVWKNGNKESLCKYFQRSDVLNERIPNNTQFIHTLVWYLKKKQEGEKERIDTKVPLRQIVDQKYTIENMAEIVEESLKQRQNKEMSLKDRIDKILLDINFPVNLKGYKYVVTSILVCYYNPMMYRNFCGGVFQNVAKEYDATGDTVRTTIQNSIKRTWERGNLSTIQKYFPSITSLCEERPSSKKFIITIVEYLRNSEE